MAATLILKNPHCSYSTMNLCTHIHSVVTARIEEPWMLTLATSHLSSHLFDISFYWGSIDSLLHCIYLLSFGHFMTLEVIPNDEAEHLVTIIYCLWRVFEVLMWLPVNIEWCTTRCRSYLDWSVKLNSTEI